MLDAAVVGELLLELRRERSGREPARLEGVQHVGALLVAERGRGEAERGCAGARCHGGKSRGWILRERRLRTLARPPRYVRTHPPACPQLLGRAGPTIAPVTSTAGEDASTPVGRASTKRYAGNL